MKVFEYNFDNNENYSEDHSEFSIFSFEQVPMDEFLELVRKASKKSCNYHDLARNVMQMDDRFFLPTRQATVYFGDDRDDENGRYTAKLRGFYYKL